MTKKNIFPVVATIAVVGIVLGVFSTTVLRDSNVSISTMTSEQAYANLSSKMKRIGVQEVSVNPQQLDVSEFLDAKDELPDIFHASSSVIADIFEACGIDLPDYVRVLYYNDYMGDESIGRAAIEKIELVWQADPSKFRVDKKQNRLIYSYPPDGPWYELKYIADELPNSLEAEISGGNQLIMNYEQAQELFGIKFRRWLGIFNL